MHLSLNNYINYRFSWKHHKISRTIWDKLVRVKCSKAIKLHERVRRVIFVVLGKYKSADLTQIVREKTWLTVNNVHAKIRLSFPLSPVYFVSCLTGSAACLCTVAEVVRASQQEVASIHSFQPLLEAQDFHTFSSGFMLCCLFSFLALSFKG